MNACQGEQKLAKLSDTLVHLKHKDALDRQAAEQKDHLLAAVTHELRTPLNGIIGLSESMLQVSTGDKDGLPAWPRSRHCLAVLISTTMTTTAPSAQAITITQHNTAEQNTKTSSETKQRAQTKQRKD
jgi:signal transduction histidine kinase